MKCFAILLSLFFLSFLDSKSQTYVETGNQPLQVFQKGPIVHVFTNTIDKNFNGVFDTGDDAAKWFRYSAETREVLDSTIFPWGSLGFPLRIGTDTTANKIYVPLQNSIAEYDLQTGLLLDSLFLEIPVRSVFTNGKDFGIVDKNSALKKAYKLSKHTSGDFVQQAIGCTIDGDSTAIAFINEGAFGSKVDDSYLTILSKNYELTISLGRGANHILKYMNKLYITMNGSHEIVVFDLTTKLIEKRISTQTSGFNGPRESVIPLLNDTIIYTTTYTNDVRIFSLFSGELLHTISIQNGKPESITSIEETILITVPVNSDFSPAKQLIVIKDTIVDRTITLVRWNPIYILAKGTDYFLFCNRVDKNFNSIKDSEDSDAWILKFQTIPLPGNNVGHMLIDSISLEWSNLGFPARCSFDSKKEKIFVTCNDTVRSYSTSILKLLENEVTPFRTSYFSETSPNIFVAGIRSKINYAVLYSQTKTGIFPQSSSIAQLSDSTEVFVVLNEGNFTPNAGDGSLSISHYGKTETFLIGSSANHFFIEKDIAFVTMNGSHEVTLFDLVKRQVTKRYPINTTGFSGPRESIMYGDKLFTTTYSGDIYSINLTTNEVKNTIKTIGIPEGLAIVRTDGMNSIWTTLAYKDENFTIDSRIQIFEFKQDTTFTTVVENSSTSNQLSMNGSMIQYNSNSNNTVGVTIYSIQGERLFYSNLIPNSSQIPFPTLGSGLYIITVTDGTKLTSLLCSVVQ